MIQDYGFRLYNPSIAKFLSVDPLTASYPWYTPYQFAGNTPIQAIDIDGLEEIHYSKVKLPNGKTAIKLAAGVDYVEWVWNSDTYSLDQVVNQKRVYILHETHKVFLNGNIVEYDATETFDSFEELIEAGDVGYTWEDFGYGILQGMENIAEEKSGRGGRGRYKARLNTIKSHSKPSKPAGSNFSADQNFSSNKVRSLNQKGKGVATVNADGSKKYEVSDSKTGNLKQVHKPKQGGNWKATPQGVLVKDSKNIEFSHPVKATTTFRKGSEGSVSNLAQKLEADPSLASRLPPIAIAKIKGKVYSLNNKRLKAHKMAGEDIYTRQATPEEINTIKQRLKNKGK